MTPTLNEILASIEERITQANNFLGKSQYDTRDRVFNEWLLEECKHFSINTIPALIRLAKVLRKQRDSLLNLCIDYANTGRRPTMSCAENEYSEIADAEALKAFEGEKE